MHGARVCHGRRVPARLHHERIARSGEEPRSWLVLTHGMYGTGGNWRGIARKINERRPEWGVVLCDLRNHGRSDSGEPPHTVDACAADVVAMIGELVETPVRALAGHSFGGKVMLAVRMHVRVAQTWLLDSTPFARTHPTETETETADGALRVLEMLERMPTTWESREAFVQAVLAEGHGQAFTQWLAMNIVPRDGTFVLRMPLAALGEMMDDYRQVDRWDQALAPQRGELEIVVADRGGVFTQADLARVVNPPPFIHVHHVAAGHWLHVEAATAVVDLFVERLP